MSIKPPQGPPSDFLQAVYGPNAHRSQDAAANPASAPDPISTPAFEVKIPPPAALPTGLSANPRLLFHEHPNGESTAKKTPGQIAAQMLAAAENIKFQKEARKAQFAARRKLFDILGLTEQFPIPYRGTRKLLETMNSEEWAAKIANLRKEHLVFYPKALTLYQLITKINDAAMKILGHPAIEMQLNGYPHATVMGMGDTLQKRIVYTPGSSPLPRERARVREPIKPRKAGASPYARTNAWRASLAEGVPRMLNLEEETRKAGQREMILEEWLLIAAENLLVHRTPIDRMTANAFTSLQFEGHDLYAYYGEPQSVQKSGWNKTLKAWVFSSIAPPKSEPKIIVATAIPEEMAEEGAITSRYTYNLPDFMS